MNGSLNQTVQIVGTPEPKSLQEQFVLFAKHGEPKLDGSAISLIQSDKWLKQARIIDGKRVTTVDTGLYFNKFRSQTIGFQDFLSFIEDLALGKGLPIESMKKKLAECGVPSQSSTKLYLC